MISDDKIVRQFLLEQQPAQLPRATERRIHGLRVVEQCVVYLVLDALPIVPDDWLKAVAPEDLRRQIGGFCLRGLAGGLCRSFQGDDDFEPLVQEFLGGHIVERGCLVYRVHDDGGPQEEDFRVVRVDVKLRRDDKQ